MTTAPARRTLHCTHSGGGGGGGGVEMSSLKERSLESCGLAGRTSTFYRGVTLRAEAGKRGVCCVCRWRAVQQLYRTHTVSIPIHCILARPGVERPTSVSDQWQQRPIGAREVQDARGKTARRNRVQNTAQCPPACSECSLVSHGLHIIHVSHPLLRNSPRAVLLGQTGRGDTGTMIHHTMLVIPITMIPG